MAPATETRPARRDNDLDSLFGYDIDNNDLFRDIDTNIQAPENGATKRKAAELDDGLGIDEEIKITKKRKPIAKLDEARLLSQAGIPKLRRTAKEKLRFKGKGYEYADCLRLLNFYQLWLDDLYPRAKFADGLSIIEKLGHTKRMQVMRKEWIDEGKPKAFDDFDLPPQPEPETQAKSTSEQPAATGGEVVESIETSAGETQRALTSIFGNGSSTIPKKKKESNDLFFTDDEDEMPKRSSTSHEMPEEDDDDLDALLAEHDARTTTSNPAKSGPPAPDPDEDDLDALLAERSEPSATEARRTVPHEEDKEDDLDALLAERSVPQATEVKKAVVAVDEDEEDDDLDALLAEQ